MRRWTLPAILLMGLGLFIPAQSAERAPHHTRSRARYYRHKTFGRGALAGAAAGAGIAHWRNSPHEWGHGFAGYGRRFGSGLAQHGVKNGIEFGVGALRHEEFGYTRSNRRGFGPRMKHVAAGTFLARRRNHRKRSVAAGRLSGAFGSGMVSRLWQPARLRTVGAGVQSGGISLGAGFAANTAREFGPDLKKRLRHRRSR